MSRNIQEFAEIELSEVLSEVRIPLENLKFVLAQHLQLRGRSLDAETRVLLTGVHDCIGRLAGSTKGMLDRQLFVEEPEPEDLIWQHPN